MINNKSSIYDNIIQPSGGSGGGGTDPADKTRITNLENNEYKITYWQTILTNSGTVTIPTGATIILDSFMEGVDALVETISNGQPTGFSPVTAGNSYVTVSSFDAAGNYTLSGTPTSFPVALLFIIKIKALDYSNLNINNILTSEPVKEVVQTINSGDLNHSPSSDAVFTALATKLTKASNLSDLANISTSRTNLGLGDSATKNTGITTGTVAAGDDSRFPSQSSIAASVIDWLFTHSYKTLAANTTFTFNNAADGKTIIVAVTNTASNYTVTWPTVKWTSGAAPVQTVGVKTDIYTFVQINGIIYGSYVQNLS